MDCSPPGSSVNGILQTRILEWIALPSSSRSSQPRDQTHVSYVCYTGRQVFYYKNHLGSLRNYRCASLLISLKKSLSRLGMNISMTLLTLELHPQCFLFSSVQSFSHVRLFVTPWTAARQASLSITNSQSLLKLMPIESVLPSSHLILCHPLLLLPPIPPSIRVFSNE